MSTDLAHEAGETLDLSEEGGVRPVLEDFPPVPNGAGVMEGAEQDRGDEVPLTVVAAACAPLAFLGVFWPALVGVSLWGLGMGVHESIIPDVLVCNAAAV